MEQSVTSIRRYYEDSSFCLVLKRGWAFHIGITVGTSASYHGGCWDNFVWHMDVSMLGARKGLTLASIAGDG